MKKPMKGAVLVGGYWVPYQQAGAWRRRVKLARKHAVSAMKTFCPYVLPQWAGSEDGEAVTGLNNQGDLMAIIHLDDNGIALIEKGVEEGNLAELLQKYNDNTLVEV